MCPFRSVCTGRDPDALSLTTCPQLYHIISLFHVVARRAIVPEPNAPSGGFVPCVESGIPFPYRHPFSPHVAALLPNFLVLLRSIHALWEPSVIQQIPPDWQMIYTIDDAYAASLLGEQSTLSSMHTSASSGGRYVDTSVLAAHDGGGEGGQAGVVRHARHFVENVRDIAYRFLQACCVPGDRFYTTKDLAAALRHSVFSGMEHLQSRHWRAVLSTFLPAFVRNCPHPLMPHLLGPLLPDVLTAAVVRFRAEWAALEARYARSHTTAKVVFVRACACACACAYFCRASWWCVLFCAEELTVRIRASVLSLV